MINKIKGMVANLYVLPPNTKEIPSEILEKENFCFFLQADKLFKLRRTNLFSVISAVDDPEDILKEYIKEEENFDPKTIYSTDGNLTDKIFDYYFPEEEFARTIAYFEWVYDKYKTEAAVLLLVNHELKEWKVLNVVNAETSGVSVKYFHPTRLDDITDKKQKEMHELVVKEYDRLCGEGWSVYGTIHSHCDFSAFHSSVDDADEENFEGLHITIGDLKSGYSYAARFMLETVPLTLEIEDIFDVEDMTKIEKMSKKIDVPQEHKDLFFERTTTASSFSGKSYGLSVYGDDEVYDWKSYGDVSQYKFNVFKSNEMLCLQHEKTGEIIYVKTSFYKKHENGFFKNYILIYWEEDTEQKKTEDDYEYDENSVFIFNEQGKVGVAEEIDEDL